MADEACRNALGYSLFASKICQVFREGISKVAALASDFDYGVALLIYLLVSHATLLGALVWLLIRHLK